MQRLADQSPWHVETHSLTKRYGKFAALDGCCLQIERGEVYGLLGPNGSGKTTLIRLLMGFLRPTSGSASIDGLDCFRQSVAVHARVGYLPGDARLFRQMRGRDVLKFFCRIRPGASYQRALELADRLQLELSRKVSMLSTGMRQKLALAGVLAADTPLVILDEPTANLDPNVRSEVLALVREAKAAGRTVIFSSHVMDEAEQACDRVGIMRRGELVHVERVAELRRQHRIRAKLTGPLPGAPAALADQLTIAAINGDVVIDTPGELSPLLGWLATLPLAEVTIEPLGLRAVYDNFHLLDADGSAGVGLAHRNGNGAAKLPERKPGSAIAAN
ncbi:MAG TPA: ABC transporter ATP-binding protein, partial [Pirellulales bacterium]|nr:ABC transporter ATP-binding protein [Pirellulales bacterium]